MGERRRIERHVDPLGDVLVIALSIVAIVLIAVLFVGSLAR